MPGRLRARPGAAGAVGGCVSHQARKMTRRDFRKLSFSYMVVLSRPGGKIRGEITKPDYQDTLARIHANQQAFTVHGNFIERWRKPTLPMRLYRKALYLLGKW